MNVSERKGTTNVSVKAPSATDVPKLRLAASRSRSQSRSSSASASASDSSDRTPPIDTNLDRIANKSKINERLTYNTSSSSEESISSPDLSSSSSMESFDEPSPPPRRASPVYTIEDDLAKLEDLAAKGHYHGPTYTLDSDPATVHRAAERAKRSSHYATGRALSTKTYVGAISLLEMLNREFLVDLLPFAIELDGWSNDVQDNIEDFEDVLLRVWERYFQQFGAENPLVELAMLTAMSGFGYHMGASFRKKLEQQKQAMQQQRQQQPPRYDRQQRQQPPAGSPNVNMPDLSSLMNTFSSMPNIPLDSSSSEDDSIEDIRKAVPAVKKIVPKKTTPKKVVPKKTTPKPKVKVVSV